MEERPISSRMQELLQRAADQHEAEQHRHGQTVESLRTRLDDLSASIATGNDRLTDKIDATFALTASTVDILQRLADRVDALERSLDDITMRLDSMSWRVDDVRDGEGRLAQRIDESALALAEAMFAGRGQRSETGGTDTFLTGADRTHTGGSGSDRAQADRPDTDAKGDLAAADLIQPAVTDQEPANPQGEVAQDRDFRPPTDTDERLLPSYFATAARFEPPSRPAEPLEPAATTAPSGPKERTEPTPAETMEPDEPARPVLSETEDRPFADVVELPSNGREHADAEQLADEPGSVRPAWGPTGDFLGSRPPVAASDAPITAFEFTSELPTVGSSAGRTTDDRDQDFFFERWAAPRQEPPSVDVAASDVSVASSNSEPTSSGVVRGGSRAASERFLREMSAARAESDRSVEAVPAQETRANDDTVPPEWFASYFRSETRSPSGQKTGQKSGQKPGQKSGQKNASPAGPSPLPGGRPAPGAV